MVFSVFAGEMAYQEGISYAPEEHTEVVDPGVVKSTQAGDEQTGVDCGFLEE
jgi:hypothetical protein